MLGLGSGSGLKLGVELGLELGLVLGLRSGLGSDIREFQNHDIKLSTKIDVYRAVVISILLYAA